MHRGFWFYTMGQLQGLRFLGDPVHISDMGAIYSAISRVRHDPGFYNCSIKIEPGEDGCEDVAVVHLSEDDQGLEAGHFAAFYQGKTFLGSGIILESWDDQGFPVYAKALDLARLEDKSLLGNPVKIEVKPELTTMEPDTEVGSTELNCTCESSEVDAPLQEANLSLHMKWMQHLRDKWSGKF